MPRGMTGEAVGTNHFGSSCPPRQRPEVDQLLVFGREQESALVHDGLAISKRSRLLCDVDELHITMVGTAETVIAFLSQ